MRLTWDFWVCVCLSKVARRSGNDCACSAPFLIWGKWLGEHAKPLTEWQLTHWRCFHHPNFRCKALSVQLPVGCRDCEPRNGACVREILGSPPLPRNILVALGRSDLHIFVSELRASSQISRQPPIYGERFSRLCPRSTAKSLKCHWVKQLTPSYHPWF